MIDHGTIQKLIEDIFAKAFEVMSKMGQYDILINNCQTFAGKSQPSIKTNILLFHGQSLYTQTDTNFLFVW